MKAKIKINKENFIVYLIKKQILNFHSDDPLNNILSNYKKFESVSKSININEINYIYFSRKKIHKILYIEEEVVNIQCEDEIIQNLSYLFFLDLLIMEDLNITNYSYSFDLIKKIHNRQKEINNNYTELLLSKIIIDLINNYEQLDQYNEEEEYEVLNEIKLESESIIRKNLTIFNEINLNLTKEDISNKKIDELFSEIIKELIINEKLENFDFAYKIINQLDLENINITEIIFKTLYKILDKDAGYINKYIIKKKEDLFDEKNINFYYTLLKYILKKEIYIYQIPLLLNLKKFILKIIKSKELLYNRLNEENNNKFEYILKILLDSEYYFNIYKNQYNEFIDQLKEVLNYYKDFLFKSKKEDIKILEDIIKNKKKNCEKYLLEYEKAHKNNIKFPIIKYLINKKNPEDAKDEDKINEVIEKWNINEDMIKKKSYKKKMRKDIKESLVTYFNDEKNKNYLLKIFTQDEIDSFIKNNTKYLKPDKNENELITTNEDKENNKKLNNFPNNINYYRNDNSSKSIKKYILANQNNQNNYHQNDEKNSIKNDYSMQNQKKSTKNDSTNFNSNINSVNNKDKESAPSIKKPNLNIDMVSKLLEKCKIYIHSNEKGKEPFIFYDKIFFGEKDIEITYEEFISNKGNYENFKSLGKKELADNFNKFLYFLKEIEDNIKKNYKNKFKLEIKLEFNKENDNNNSDSSIYNITCIYSIIEPIVKKIKSYKEENILCNGTNSNNQGFFFLLDEINSEKYNNLEYINDIQNNKISKSIERKNKVEEKESYTKKEKEKSTFLEDKSKDMQSYSTGIQSYIIDLQTKKKADPLEIIKFVKIVGEHKNSADFIVELKNGFYISGGCENILILYDAYHNEKIKIREYNDWVFKVGEKMNSKETSEDIIQLLCTTNQEFDIIELDMKTLKTNKSQYQLPKKTNINFVEMKENNIVLLGRGGASYYIDLFNSKKQLTENKITDKTYRGLIKLNDKNVSLSSNKIIPDGEDILLLYNTKKKTIPYKINNYSFVVSINNLAIMPREETKSNYKILLCACRKYTKVQQNGILLVNPQLGDNKNIDNPFYETDNFEVYCFCPILIVKNNNINFENINEKYRENITINDTDYFFVGGFDIEKREGQIKLYRIIYGSKAWETKIKFIQDIVIPNDEEDQFKDFDGPISCIIQSKISGYILVTCYNGCVYLFTPPNMESYIKEEKNDK